MKSFSIFACLSMLILLGAGCGPRGEPYSNTASNSVTDAPTVDAWYSSVQAVLKTYDESQDAKAARDQLLALMVPGQARDRHLALVLALASLADGDVSGTQRLEHARANLNSSP